MSEKEKLLQECLKAIKEMETMVLAKALLLNSAAGKLTYLTALSVELLSTALASMPAHQGVRHLKNSIDQIVKRRNLRNKGDELKLTQMIGASEELVEEMMRRSTAEQVSEKLREGILKEEK